MFIVDEKGERVHIDDAMIPEKMKEWTHRNVKMYHDDTKLEECWIASVYSTFNNENEFKGEKIYDHDPTQEELIWLMCEKNSLRFSYVEVKKGYRLYDPID